MNREEIIVKIIGKLNLRLYEVVNTYNEVFSVCDFIIAYMHPHIL